MAKYDNWKFGVLLKIERAMGQPKEYYAFISYKREDEKWAQWLQDKLEHYKFPTNLNGRIDLPKHIRPTFRDVTDSTPGLLAEEIDKALRNSEWLIVICSPRSAKSQWVCKEAQTFIDLGRADHIIPFVIEGTPFSDDPATECYPDALLSLTGSQELLAANINEIGRDAAAIKVVARMFNLRFDALWQRYERDKRNQRNKKFALVAGLILLFALGASVFAYRESEHRKDVEKKNCKIAEQRDRIQKEKIKTELANISLENKNKELKDKNDSIQKQNKIIVQQKNDLNRVNRNLQLSNKRLIEERNRALLANSRAIAEKANAMTDGGNSYFARRLALLAYYMSPSRQIEIETALRKSWDGNTAIIQGHEGRVKKALFSPDGKYIISVATDGTIRTWDGNTGLQKKCWQDNISYFNLNIDYNVNDGSLYSKIDSDTFKIRKLESGSIEHFFVKQKISEWIISPLGTQMATVAPLGSVVKMWRVYNNGIELKDSFSIASGRITSLSYSPDGNYLVIGSGGKGNDIYIWDCRKKRKVASWEAHSFGVAKVRYSSDGSKIISCGDKYYKEIVLFGKSTILEDDTIKIWDAKSGGLEHQYICKAQDVYLNSSKNLVLAIDHKDIVIINLQNGKQTRLIGHNALVNSLCFNQNGSQLLSASDDGTIRIWDMRQYGVKVLESNPNTKLLYNPDRDILLLSNGNKIIQTHLNADGSLLKNIDFNAVSQVHPTIINSVALNQEGNRYASASKALVALWDTQADTLLCVFRGPMSETNSICFTKNGKFIIAAYKNGKIRVWDINAKREWDKTNRFWAVNTPLHEWTAHNNSVNSISVSPDGNYIITASEDKMIKIWDINYNLIKQWKAHQHGIFTATYSPNGKYIVSSSLDGTIKIWNAKTYNMCGTPINVNKDVQYKYPCIISPNSKYIIYGEKSSVKIIDIEKEEVINTIDVGDRCSDISINPQENKIIVATGRMIREYTIPLIDNIVNAIKKLYDDVPMQIEERRKYYLE